MRRSRSSGTIPVTAVLNSHQPRQRESLWMKQSDYANGRESHALGQPLFANNPVSGSHFAFAPSLLSVTPHNGQMSTGTHNGSMNIPPQNGTSPNYTPPCGVPNASSHETSSRADTPGSTVRMKTPSRCALYSTPVAVHARTTQGTMFNTEGGNYSLLPSPSVPVLPPSDKSANPGVPFMSSKNGDAHRRGPAAVECFRHPAQPPRPSHVPTPAGAYVGHGNGNGMKGMMSFGNSVNPMQLGTFQNGIGTAHLWRTPTETVESTVSDRPSQQMSEAYDSESMRENGRHVEADEENGHRKTESVRSEQRSDRESGRLNAIGYYYAEDTFAVDISCLGERNLMNGINGFIKTRRNDSDENAFVKLGSHNDAMLISAKGYANGQHYWELEDCIEMDDEPGAQIRFCVGLVPRSIRQAVDIDMTIANNGGFSLCLTHGSGENEFKHGDRIGIHLDCTGHLAVMRFFKNGKFSAAGCGLSLKNIPKDKPLYPALCMMGHVSALCAFSVVPSPTMPNIVEHEKQEAAYIAVLDHEVRRTKLCTLRRPQYSDQRKREISLAHRGSTVEISSGLKNELVIRPGDAILFVEQHVDEDCEWHFEVSDDEILAQDTFYLHQEFDLHSPRAHTVVKVAYKFIALSTGVVEFKSSYAPMQGIPQWKQAVRIVVDKAVN